MNHSKKRNKIQNEALKLKKKGLVYDSKKYLANNGFCNTVDIALLTIKEGELNVLLIQRKEDPFKNCWAIPGGFVEANESALKSAERELREETGIPYLYLEQLYTFTEKGRDPREEIANTPTRIWSVAHFALVEYQRYSKLVAGSDAKRAKWFKVSKLPKLAFDHAEIIAMAIERVRGKISYTNIGFELVPEQFTMTELQHVFEAVRGEKLDRNNFRTKILSLNILQKTGKFKNEGPGKPAPYYRFDRDEMDSIRHRDLI